MTAPADDASSDDLRISGVGVTLPVALLRYLARLSAVEEPGASPSTEGVPPLTVDLRGLTITLPTTWVQRALADLSPDREVILGTDQDGVFVSAAGAPPLRLAIPAEGLRLTVDANGLRLDPIL